MLSALQDLIDWAVRECQADWRARLDATEAVYAKNGRFIDRMIDSELGTPGLTAKRLTGVRGRASAVLRRGLTPLRSRLKM